MKNHLLFSAFISLIVSASNVSAQKNFTSAKWIKPDGSQTDILIDFRQWEGAPASIKYKISEGQPEQTLLPDQVHELRVQARTEEIYIGRTTDVAVFSDEPSISPQVVSQRKKIFLRALVLGDMNLYKYQDENDIKHYFIEKDTIWEELIYHDYYNDYEQIQTRTHHRYRTQLLRATFDCAALAEKIKKLTPSEQSLIGVVSAYNSPSCKGQLLFVEEKSKGKFQIGVRGGGTYTFNSVGFEVVLDYTGKNQFFKPQYGASVLITLPRMRGSKALLIDVVYDQQEYVTDLQVPTWVKENYLQIHLSFRHYWLKKPLMPFVNGGIMYGPALGDAELMDGWRLDYSPHAQNGFTIGGGVRWDRLEVESRLVGNQMLGLKQGGLQSSFALTVMLRCWLNK